MLLPARPRAAFLPLVAAGLLAAGCAVSTAIRHGREAEQQQDYDRAVVEYMKAVRLKPGDVNARTALERTKLRGAQAHFERGRRQAALGKLEDALVEYELAAELNPSSAPIDQEVRSTRNQLRAKVLVAREGKTELQALVERTRDLPPPGLDLPTNVKMPTSLILRDATSREVFLAIGRFADISVTFDPAFRETPTTDRKSVV